MRILVIEDDLALSAGLCFELDSSGYLTVAAYNCRKARQLLLEDQFDLVIMDVNLPDGNGFDFCREVKAVPECDAFYQSEILPSSSFWTGKQGGFTFFDPLLCYIL